MDYQQLRQEAQTRRRAPTTAFMSAGVCSNAVGAGAVVEALRQEVARRGLAAAMVEAGCDGACYEGPSLFVARADAARLRLAPVTAADVPELVNRLAAGDGDGLWQGRPVSWKAAQGEDPFWRGQRRRVLARCGRSDPRDMDGYVAEGGYRALAQALASPPEEVIRRVQEANLQGRGGAYFPAARKWQSARAYPGPRYLVVNAEEGEPGVFKDRHLLEGDPHLLIEGMLIAAYAVGTEKGVIYLNGQAELAAAVLSHALVQARQRGLLGESVLGSSFAFDVEVRRGAGGYVCGEESVILESLEGQRAMPRTRPPFPTEAGLWGQPTVINNVETLANVPLVLAEGIAAETKLVCLSGSVRR
ncbi:MAG: NADH-quinone oxidoreductase subunit F, partial [Dehalococcoidia bacterium]